MCDGCLREVAGLQVAGCVGQRLCVTENATLNAQPATFFVQQNLRRAIEMTSVEIAPRIVVERKKKVLLRQASHKGNKGACCRCVA